MRLSYNNTYIDLALNRHVLQMHVIYFKILLFLFLTLLGLAETIYPQDCSLIKPTIIVLNYIKISQCRHVVLTINNML